MVRVQRRAATDSSHFNMRKVVVLTVAGVLLIVFAAPTVALPRIVLQPDLQPWIAPSAVPVVAGSLDPPYKFS